MVADLRYALRLLSRAPLFSFISIATLAIGLGCIAVVVAAINALSLRPLPHLPDDDRLVALTQQQTERGLDDLGANLVDLHDLAGETDIFEGIFHHTDLTVIFTAGEQPRRYLGNTVSAGTFELLGVEPLLGRTLLPTDAASDAPPVAVISHAVWQEQFAGNPEVIGTAVPLNGVPTRIVGVMPPGWRFPEISDVWLPFPGQGKAIPLERGEYYVAAGARLRPGVTLAEAQARSDQVMESLAQLHPETNTGVTIRLQPFRDAGSDGPRHLTFLLLGAVLCIFFIACANVAHLQLARCTSRTPELALRQALGASRARIIRQLLAEGVVLALFGGAAGALAGLWGTDLMVAAIPRDLPFWLDFTPDGRVLGVILLAALGAGVGLGIVPAWRLSRWQIVQNVQQGDRLLHHRSRTNARLRHGLVVAQIALALVLLIGAGLMLRSFVQLRRVNPGFVAERVETFRVGIPTAMTAQIDPGRFFDDVLARVASDDAVEAAAAISPLPGAGSLPQLAVQPLGPCPLPAGTSLTASTRTVTPGLFQTLQIALLSGRDFDARDQVESPPVAIIDAELAKRCFGGVEAAVGRKIRVHYRSTLHPDAREVTVIGVVAPIRQRLERAESHAGIYFPHAQRGDSFLSVVVRTKAKSATFFDDAQAVVWSVQPSIPIYATWTLSDVLLRSPGVWTHQFFSRLFAIAGAIALLLACIGIYGVMTFHVCHQRHEIGVRMALGAPAVEVVRTVVRQGLQLVTYGLSAGVAAAALLAHLLGGILYGISPLDPLTFLLVPTILGLVAIVTCYVPTRRATRIDPVVALRGD